MLLGVVVPTTILPTFSSKSNLTPGFLNVFTWARTTTALGFGQFNYNFRETLRRLFQGTRGTSYPRGQWGW